MAYVPSVLIPRKHLDDILCGIKHLGDFTVLRRRSVKQEEYVNRVLPGSKTTLANRRIYH